MCVAQEQQLVQLNTNWLKCMQQLKSWWQRVALGLIKERSIAGQRSTADCTLWLSGGFVLQTTITLCEGESIFCLLYLLWPFLCGVCRCCLLPVGYPLVSHSRSDSCTCGEIYHFHHSTSFRYFSTMHLLYVLTCKQRWVTSMGWYLCQ